MKWISCSHDEPAAAGASFSVLTTARMDAGSGSERANGGAGAAAIFDLLSCKLRSEKNEKLGALGVQWKI